MSEDEKKNFEIKGIFHPGCPDQNGFFYSEECLKKIEERLQQVMKGKDTVLHTHKVEDVKIEGSDIKVYVKTVDTLSGEDKEFIEKNKDDMRYVIYGNGLVEQREDGVKEVKEFFPQMFSLTTREGYERSLGIRKVIDFENKIAEDIEKLKDGLENEQ